MPHRSTCAPGARAGHRVVAIAALLVVVCAYAAVAVKVNFVSDEHYDPAYGTPSALGPCKSASAPTYGQVGCDSPRQLLVGATNDIMSQRSAYTFYGGDWQRHQMGATNLNTTDVFVPLSDFFNRTLRSSSDTTFYTPRVTTVLGNNDVFPDYGFNISDTTQAILKTQIGVMQRYGLLNTSQGMVMARCGYYSGVANRNLRVLALHSLLWTYRLIPALTDTETDPCGQLAWMESEINAARSAGQQVIIIGHIPPQPNVFGVLQRGAVDSVENDMYWKPMYQSVYTNLLSTNRDIIRLQLYGHTHRFAILGDTDMGVPLIVMNAISPIYANQPAYLIADFDTATWRLRTLVQRYADDGYAWWYPGLEVSSALSISDLSDVSSINSAVTNMFTDDNAFNNYLTLRTGGLIDDPCMTTFCRVYTLCAMLHAEHGSVGDCVRAQIPTSSSDGGSSSGTPTPPIDPSIHVTTRPQYHIRPPSEWINDPNGPYRDPVTGKIHLYMQYSPNGPLHGDIGWYHFTSDDYVKWSIPTPAVAMNPDKWYDKWGAYSGTIMNNNHSVPVVIYTCAEPENIQRQCIATFSTSDLDGKRTLNTFEKSPLNPVITEESVPGLVGLGNFRDPTEWWQDPAHPERWLIGFVARIQDADGDNAHVVVFSTEDPTFQSGYSFSHSLYMYKYDLDKMFECADFFTLRPGGEHYLKVSTMPSRRDFMIYGSYQLDAATSQYVYVEDPARTFTFLDYGTLYASKTFHDPILNRRTIWGWVYDELSDAQIGSQGWSGVQNLLRNVEYDSVEKKIKSSPIPELKGLRQSHLYWRQAASPLTLVDGAPQTLIAAGTTATLQHEIIVTFTLSSMAPFDGTTYYTESTAPEFGVMIRASADLSQYTSVSVRMPVATRQPIVNRAQDTQWPPLKMYPGASTNAVSNCSAECVKQRMCVSWTYTTAPSPTCALYWRTSGRTFNSTAQSGTANIPQLYMNRVHSGSIGSTAPLLGRAPVKQTNPNVVKLHIFVDDSVVEVFKDGGLETMTGRLYLPNGANTTGIAVYAKNMGSATVTATAEIFSMGSAFAPAAGPDVIRNFTNSYYNLLVAMGITK